MINDLLETIGRRPLTDPEKHVKMIECKGQDPRVSVLSDAFSSIENCQYVVTDVWMNIKTLVSIKDSWNISEENNRVFGACLHLLDQDKLIDTIVFASSEPEEGEENGIHYCIVRTEAS